MTRLGFLVLWSSFCLSMSGCAEVMYRYDQSTATAALAAMACKDTLSAANEPRVAECGQFLKSGDKPGAQKCLDDWKATYAKVDMACKGIKDAAKIALASREVVAASASKKADVLGWVARLAKLGLDLFVIFKDAGITYTGGK